MGLKTELIPVLTDNYIFLIQDEGSGETAVVDPAEAGPVLDRLNSFSSGRLDYILNTHHHFDHVGGNERLKVETGCRIVGPSYDAARIPGIGIEVSEGDSFKLGESEADVLFLPGHTRGHIAFWFRTANALFVGDTLFAAGCGRLFEGTAAQMWRSLKKLKRLPPEAKVYCAHEYTLANLAFALSLEADSEVLQQRQKHVRALVDQGLPSIPTTMAEEFATNPFLRADDLAFKKKLGLTDKSDEDVFAAIRQAKDRF